MPESASRPIKFHLSHSETDAALASDLLRLVIEAFRLTPSEVQTTATTTSSLVSSGIRARRPPGIDAQVFAIMVSVKSPGGGRELLSLLDEERSEGAPDDEQPLRIVIALPGVRRDVLPEPYQSLSLVEASDELKMEEFIGQLAGELVTEGTFDMASQRPPIMRFVRRVRGERKLSPRALWMGVAGLMLAMLAGTGSWMVLNPSRNSGNPERFGFEQDANGWVALGSDLGGGCVTVRRSDEEAKTGDYALELDMVLDAARDSKRSGEVAWDAAQSGAGKTAADRVSTVDLTDKTVTMWVYATAGADGEAETPNGIQLFVKDGDWRSQYSQWVNVEPERWAKLTLAVGKRGEGGHLDDGLQTSAIRLVGMKMSVGETSQASFEGPVFVDAVGW